MRKCLFGIALAMLLLSTLWVVLETRQASSWSNGGFSSDPTHPVYGTHDWIAQHALDWLLSTERQDILNNLATFLYGTELPDNGGAPDGIGDTALHHFYYWSNGSTQDDASAVRAQTEYDKALNYSQSNNTMMAVKTLGIMSHYIVDLSVFGHVMAVGTDWGPEVHHADYETYVDQHTNNYTADFDSYLAFDGNLDLVSAYDAARLLAYDTTFDPDGNRTCVWMDQNYDWNNSTFTDRVGESLNLAVNYLADVLHTFAKTISQTLTVNVAGTNYIVTLLSNYVISNHSFNPTLGQLSFHLEALTTGPCNATIPKSLLSGGLIVYLHDAPTSSIVSWNATHSCVYFTSTEVIDEVKIIGEYMLPIQGDINHDGIVNILDAVILSNHFLQHYP